MPQEHRVQLPEISFKANRLGNQRFLVVDDNYPTARIVVDILKAAGAKSASAVTDGRRAIQALPYRRPDVIITDWTMPVMNGIEMVREIRKAALVPDPRVPNPRVPIIMLTGRRSVDDIEEARTAGVNEFVIKPFSPASLLSRIEMLQAKPRAFVTQPHYVGPDRRRRVEPEYAGALRRLGDPRPLRNAARKAGVRETIYSELDNLRTLLTTRKSMNRELLKMALHVIEQNVYRARQIRDPNIQQAAQDLLNYLQSIQANTGDGAKIDAYLESVCAFCSVLEVSGSGEGGKPVWIDS
jgi:CheY-like chemotaxis protein